MQTSARTLTRPETAPHWALVREKKTCIDPLPTDLEFLHVQQARPRRRIRERKERSPLPSYSPAVCTPATPPLVRGGRLIRWKRPHFEPVHRQNEQEPAAQSAAKGTTQVHLRC